MKDQKSQVPLDEQASKKLVQEFIHLFSALQQKRDDYPVHPSDQVLNAYVGGALPDAWMQPDVEETSAESWTLSQVSFHVATCKRCDRVVKKLRRPKRKASRFEDYFCAFGITGQRGRMWAFSYATSVALLFAMMMNVSLTLNNHDPLINLHLTTTKITLRQQLDSAANYQRGNWKVTPLGLQASSNAVRPSAAYIHTLRQQQIEKKIPFGSASDGSGVMP